MTRGTHKALVRRAAEPYRQCGRFAFHGARGKLSADPAFAAILEHGLIPDGANVLDIGCGKGLLAAWLLAAGDAASGADYPASWRPAPASISVHGIDLDRKDVGIANKALGDRCSFSAGDICSATIARSDVIVALDVLHYISEKDQADLLGRIHAALRPDGILILRIGDAGQRMQSILTRLVDRIVLLMRGQNALGQHCRSKDQWFELLESIGFRATTLPIEPGIVFANVLIVAKPEGR